MHPTAPAYPKDFNYRNSHESAPLIYSNSHDGAIRTNHLAQSNQSTMFGHLQPQQPGNPLLINRSVSNGTSTPADSQRVTLEQSRQAFGSVGPIPLPQAQVQIQVPPMAMNLSPSNMISRQDYPVDRMVLNPQPAMQAPTVHQTGFTTSPTAQASFVPGPNAPISNSSRIQSQESMSATQEMQRQASMRQIQAEKTAQTHLMFQQMNVLPPDHSN